MDLFKKVNPLYPSNSMRGYRKENINRQKGAPMFDEENRLEEHFENRSRKYKTSLSENQNRTPANPISSGGPEYQVPNYQSAL